jgi:hypothetical protein
MGSGGPGPLINYCKKPHPEIAAIKAAKKGRKPASKELALINVVSGTSDAGRSRYVARRYHSLSY